MARVYIGALLIDHANWSKLDVPDGEVALRHCTNPCWPLVGDLNTSLDVLEKTKMIALDIDPKTGKPQGCGNIGPDGKPRSRL